MPLPYNVAQLQLQKHNWNVPVPSFCPILMVIWMHILMNVRLELAQVSSFPGMFQDSVHHLG